MTSTRRTPRARAVRRSHALAEAGVGLVLALAVTLAACSGDPSEPSADPGDGDPAASGATDASAVATNAMLGKVRGQLPQGKRSKVREQVAHAVDAWFDAAYVGGDYPRNDFSDSWPGFTTGAKADAQDDKMLMSNFASGAGHLRGRGHHPQGLRRRACRPGPRASGATARFVLKFRTDGDVQRKVEVRGRLFLTPGAEGWRIFGYDVAKGRWA